VSTTDEPYPIREPDASVADLAGRLSSQLGDMVGTHIELAKVEIQEEVRTAGKGAGMLGGGAVAGHLAVLLLSFAAAWGLAEVMAAGFAFLIVGALWAVVAAVLAMKGREEMQQVDVVPPGTVEELKEDKRWMSSSS
jgi:uncharacterized membrane protein YqjE